MLEHPNTPRWKDPAARIISAVAVPVVMYFFWGRLFFGVAAAPLLLVLPGSWGLAALAVAAAAGVLQAVTGISLYAFFPAVFMFGMVLGLLLKRGGVSVGKGLTPWLGVAGVVFLLLVFVRGVFWLDSMALAGGYGSIFLGWARGGGGGIRRVAMRVVVSAGLVAVSALMAVLLAELMARAVYGSPRRVDIGNTRPHPVRVSTLTPGFSGEGIVDDGNTPRRIPFSYSSQGLRDIEIGPKQPGEFRIVMIGDSYTAGLTMLLEQTIPKQVEAKLRDRLPRKITVINAGVPGYGPWQERDFLRELGFPLEPDFVIQQILPSNDIDNTLCRVGKFPEAYSTQWRSRYHYMLLRTAWQMQADRWLCETSKLYVLISNATKRRFLIDALNRIRFVPALNVPELAASAARSELIEVNLRAWYPVLEEGWAMMEDDMRGIRDDCRERGVGLMMYAVPIQQSVQDSWWQLTTKGLDIYERDKDTRIVREFCNRENIPFIEILPALRNHPRIESLYYNPDGHFTPAGAELVAGVIADHLCAHYFADCQGK